MVSPYLQLQLRSYEEAWADVRRCRRAEATQYEALSPGLAAPAFAGSPEARPAVVQTSAGRCSRPDSAGDGTALITLAAFLFLCCLAGRDGAATL